MEKVSLDQNLNHDLNNYHTKHCKWPIGEQANCILGDPGADSGGEGKSTQAEKYGAKKSKERRKEPLGTMSYQTSSKRSLPFWLLIGAKFSGTN